MPCRIKNHRGKALFMTRIIFKNIFFLLIIGVPLTLEGQSILDKKVHFSAFQLPLTEALYELSVQADVNISFSAAFFDTTEKVNLKIGERSLGNILEIILANTGIGFREWEGNILLFRKPIPYIDLCGYVRDVENGEALPWATIFHPASGKGVQANAYGYYCLKLPTGNQQLEFSYVGYEKAEFTVKVKKGVKLDVNLHPSITFSEVVLVSAPVAKTVQEAPNQQNILTARLATFVAPGGEPDLLRMVQALPGVQSGADGFGGLHIRGGNADQNLILMDDVPVFNPSHTAGLFSIFNTSMVKSAVLTKGGFPARYGGRLSSVLEVRTKEGSLEKPSASVGIGLLATSIQLETPIVKDRISLILTGRRSQLDSFLRNRSMKKKAQEGKMGETNYHFFDANAKLHIRLSENDRLYLSYYTGRDRFADFSEKDSPVSDRKRMITGINYNYNWGNRIASLRWNHLYGKRLFSNTTFISSHFNYNSNIEDSGTSFYNDKKIIVNTEKVNFSSAMEAAALRSDFDFFYNESHHLKWGAGITRRVFVPSILNSVLEDDFIDSMQTFTTPLVLDSVDYAGTEVYTYLSDGWKGKKWEVNGGIYTSWFNAGKLNHFSLQPRLSIRFSCWEKTTLSVTASRMTQHLHLLTTTDAGLPNDLWVPATLKARPENAWQSTIGIHQKIKEAWLLNSEIYWKYMDGLLSYTDSVFSSTPAQTVDATSWESLAISGKGKSVGWEVLLEKNKGDLRGWISYTLSKTERKFNEDRPYRFDSRHVVHLTMAYRLANWLEANLSWAYQSGLPVRDFERLRTNFIFSDIFEVSNTRIQKDRLPAYHRLDLGIAANWTTGKLIHQISLGIYNAYNRKNAFLVFPAEDGTAWMKINSLPLLPSIRWTGKIH